MATLFNFCCVEVPLYLLNSAICFGSLTPCTSQTCETACRPCLRSKRSNDCSQQEESTASKIAPTKQPSDYETKLKCMIKDEKFNKITHNAIFKELVLRILLLKFIHTVFCIKNLCITRQPQLFCDIKQMDMGANQIVR